MPAKVQLVYPVPTIQDGARGSPRCQGKDGAAQVMHRALRAHARRFLDYPHFLRNIDSGYKATRATSVGRRQTSASAKTRLVNFRKRHVHIPRERTAEKLSNPVCSLSKLA